MIIRRAYLFRLTEDGQSLNILETADGDRVEFICDGGHFFLDKEEARELAHLIDPNSFGSERIRYSFEKTDETV